MSVPVCFPEKTFRLKTIHQTDCIKNTKLTFFTVMVQNQLLFNVRHLSCILKWILKCFFRELTWIQFHFHWMWMSVAVASLIQIWWSCGKPKRKLRDSMLRTDRCGSEYDQWALKRKIFRVRFVCHYGFVCMNTVKINTASSLQFSTHHLFLFSPAVFT